MQIQRTIQTFSGVDLIEITLKRLPVIQIGDEIVYDRLANWENAHFKNLEDFKRFLDMYFEYENICGEEYNSWCFYRITNIKSIQN